MLVAIYTFIFNYAVTERELCLPHILSREPSFSPPISTLGDVGADWGAKGTLVDVIKTDGVNERREKRVDVERK